MRTRPRAIAIVMALVFALSSFSFTFAASSIKVGDNVNYSNSNRTFKSGKYVGKCTQAGKPHKSSGTAKVTRKIDNTSDVAKAAYYWTYVKPKLTSTDVPKGYDFTGENSTYALITNFVIQYLVQGKSDWKTGMAKDYDSGAISKFERCVEDMIDESSETEVPSSFEMYALDEPDSDYQNFMLWRFQPYGKIKLQKQSAVTGITG